MAGLEDFFRLIEDALIGLANSGQENGSRPVNLGRGAGLSTGSEAYKGEAAPDSSTSYRCRAGGDSGRRVRIEAR